MLSLHKVTEEIRVLLKWAGIILGGFLLLFFLIRIGTSIKEYFFPTPLPSPTVSFGKLPHIAFPKNATDKQLTYTINTLTETLPDFTDRMPVYKTVTPQPNLLALKRARDKVSKAGFTQEDFALSTTRYQWSDPNSPISRRILLNILTYNFDFTSDYLIDPKSLQNQKLPSENRAIEIAKSLFSAISFIPQDIDDTKTTTTLLSITDGGIIGRATSFSKANMIRVDFFQRDINGFPMYYPHPPQSIINAFVVSDQRDKEITQAHFFHQEIIDDSSTTYPIKTANEAFEQLKKGNAYIASYFGGDEKINITNVFLGYYAPDKESKYILPIIVFEGNNGFYGYVLAIKDEWIE